MAITTMDQLIQTLAGSQKKDIYKVGRTSEGAGTWQSYWSATGFWLPATALAPSSSGSLCASSITGACDFDNPASGTTYLGQVVLSGTATGKLIIYDRLWHCSGLGTTATEAVTSTWTAAAQWVTRPSVSAYGEGAELWIQCLVANGATASKMWIQYVDSSASANNWAQYALPANILTVGQMGPCILANTDTGVAAVTGYYCSSTSGAAGDLGLVILRRIAEIPIPVINVGNYMDFAALGLPVIYPSAAVALMTLCSGTTSPTIQGIMNIISGSW